MANLNDNVIINHWYKMPNNYSRILIFIMIIISVLYIEPFCQSKRTEDKSLELNAGVEYYRKALVGGIAYNFYVKKYLALSPGIDIIGVPILSGNLKFPISFTKALRISPKIGAGILPIGFLLDISGIVGIRMSYTLLKNFDIFLETKIIFVAGQVIAIGPEYFSKKNIKDFPPLNIVFGVEF